MFPALDNLFGKLLDLELASGDVNQALQDFNILKPVHLDDSSGDLHKDYFRILETIYKRMDAPDGSILLALNDEIAYFLEKNKNSSSYPEIYLLHGKIMYNYLDREEGVRILNELSQQKRPGNKGKTVCFSRLSLAASLSASQDRRRCGEARSQRIRSIF